jgi:PKD repeat protein
MAETTVRSRRSALVMFVATLALIAAGLVAPTPAAAGLSVPIPADEFGDPNDDFTDANALFAYMLSDTKGGYICAIKADAGPGCAHPAVGTKTRVFGIGTTYTLVWGRDIPAGLYRLATENSLGEPTASSDVFSVTACPTCSRVIRDAIVQQVKDTAAALADAFGDMCLLNGVLKSVAGKATGMRGLVKVLKVRTFGYGPQDNDFVTTENGTTSITFEDPFTAGINKALSILKDLTCDAKLMYSNIADDPPDAGFATVAPPEYASIYPLTPSSLDALARSVDRERGLGTAMLHGYERYQGATAAHDVDGQQRQLQATGENATALANELLVTADKLRAWATTAAADTELAGVALTSAAATELDAIYARITASGFNADEIASAHALGYTDADLAMIRTHFAVSTAGVPVDKAYPEVLQEIASSLQEQADAVAAFGGAALVAAGRIAALNAPPVATFTRTPKSGTKPLDVAFNAAGATDPDGTIASYTWSFGDGATGTGVAPHHLYTEAGVFTAMLTVTDNKGATDAIAGSVTVAEDAPENTPPHAQFLPDAQNGPIPLTVHVDGTPSGDNEGPISSWSWNFGDGATATGPKATHTYTAAGDYTLSLTVTDGAGATDQTTLDMHATAPNHPPTALLDVTPAFGSAPLDVTFTDQSTDLDGDALTRQWGFWDSSADASDSVVTKHITEPGSYTMNLRVCDAVTCTQTTRLVVVDDNEPGNTIPVAADDAVTTREDRQVDINMLSNDTDADGNPLAATTFGQPSHGHSECYYALCTYTSVPGYSGPDSFPYSISDGHGGHANAVINVTVTADGAPSAVDDAGVVGLNQPATIEVAANDSDPDGDQLKIVASTPPSHGTAGCTATACTYFPATGYLGPDSFTYTVADDLGKTAVATVSIDVVANRPPTPVDDSVGNVHGDADFDVMANDSDPDIAAELTLTTVIQPEHGTASCSPTGSCHYEADSGYEGGDSFTYTVRDSGNLTASATVTLGVFLPDADSGGGGGVGAGPGAIPPPAGAGFVVTTSGASDVSDDPAGTVGGGHSASWAVHVATTPDELSDEQAHQLPAAHVTVTSGGNQTIKPDSLTTVPGWTAGLNGNEITATAGAGALLGSATDRTLPPPLPPISQGTGGDGHVPIPVGSRVFAFFHHSEPTSVSCVDRATGLVCPGYPKTLHLATQDAPGAGVVVGTKIWVHLVSKYGSDYAQSAPSGLFCWDTAADKACGWHVFERQQRLTNGPDSIPVLAAGKVWFATISGRLFCLDGATGNTCPGVVYGDPSGEVIDVAAHGDHVYVGRGNDVVCVDATTHSTCSGWPESVHSDHATGNLVNEFDATGTPVGVCGASGTNLDCWSDADAAAHSFTDWPPNDGTYSYNAEAESGTRTLNASFSNGLACYDWVTHALCADPGYNIYGQIQQDTNGDFLPSAYGAAWDGSCAIGLGDPGQVFTVDVRGISPCNSVGSGERRVIDLRSQRCDGTVGDAGWQALRLLDTDLTAGTEFSSFVAKVHDAATDAVLASRELVGTDGTIDLTGISAALHPAVYVEIVPTSIEGDPAWDDATPPRLRLEWTPDPAQICVDTTTLASCGQAEPLAVSMAAKVDDGEPATATLALTPDCLAPNRAPVARTDALQLEEGDVATLGVLANDTDPDGDPLHVTGTSGATHGTVTCSASGACDFVPTTNYLGGASFQYSISDGRGGSDTTLVSLTVTSVNDPPVAVGDSATLAQGGTTLVDVLANDSPGPANESGQHLTLDSITAAALHGTAVLESGKVRYTPAAGYSGLDAVTYKVCDDGTTGGAADPRCAEANIAVTVTPAAATFSLSVQVSGAGSGRVVSTPAGIDCTAGTCTATYDAGTPVSLAATADSGSGFTGWTGDCTGTGSRSTTISAARTVNAAFGLISPTLTAVDDSVTLAEDGSAPVAVLTNDVNTGSSVMAVSGHTTPAHGGVVCTPTSCTYTPAADYFGPDSFDYTVVAGALTDSGTVSVTVTPVNDAPVPAGDSDTLAEDGTTLVDVLANDSPGPVNEAAQQLTLTSLPVGPAHGTASIENGKVRYTPTANYFGGDSVTYRVCDNGVTGVAADPLCANAVLALTVTSVVDQYVLTVQISGAGNGRVVSTPAGIDCTAGTCTASYDEGTPVSLASTVGAASAFGGWSNDCTGTAGCSVTMSAARTVGASYTHVDQPPVAVDDDLTVAEDSTGGSVQVLTNDGDPENDALSVTGSTTPAHGTSSCTAAGVCSYTPAADYVGPDSFTYTLSAGGKTDVGAVSVTVTAVNDRPTAAVPSTATVQYSDAIAPLTVTLSDADDLPGTLLVGAVGLPAGLTLGSVTPVGTAQITGTVTAAAGSYPVTITVSDGRLTNTASTTITVTREDATAVYDGPTTVSTPDGSAVPVALSAQVTETADGSLGDISRARVFFDVYASGAPAGAPPFRTTGPWAPDATGDVNDSTSLAEGSWLVVVRFDGTNTYYAGPSSNGTVVTVAAPAPGSSSGKVTGGGWVPDDGGKGTFGFVVQTKKGSDVVSGNSVYLWRDAGGTHVARVTSWVGGSLLISSDRRTASFVGNATLGNDATRPTVGDGGYTMKVDLVDGRLNGKRTGPDRYAISIWRGSTLVHRSAASPAAVGGGTLIIH